MILEPLVVGPFMSNCYVVGSEASRKGMVIDPGAEAAEILDTLGRYKLSVEYVVLTHTHIDHLGAVAQVLKSTGARLAVHEAEGQGRTYQSVARMLGQMLGGTFDELPEVNKLLKDGDILEAGELRLKVLHTPGHSPGGISLLADGVVFTGDTLFAQGIGRTDFPGCSFDELMKSIHTKLLSLPDDTKVYPGHGPATTIGNERLWNPFLRM